MSAGGNISMSKHFRLNFYSANLVSDKVCVVRKTMMTNSAFWSRQLVAVSIYTKDTQIVHGGVNRGTKMIGRLKEDQSEFLEERRQ